LDLVKEENGKVIKSKLYLASETLVEDMDHDKTVEEVVEIEEELIRKGAKFFNDQMDNIDKANADIEDIDKNKVLQSYG